MSVILDDEGEPLGGTFQCDVGFRGLCVLVNIVKSFLDHAIEDDAGFGCEFFLGV